MGSICCCFHVPEVEENAEPNNSSNHGNCMCPNCFVHSIKDKYGELFGRVKMQAIPSSVRGSAPSSSSMVAPDNQQIETGTNMPNNANLSPQIESGVNVQNRSNSGVNIHNRSNSGEESKDVNLQNCSNGGVNLHNRSSSGGNIQKLSYSGEVSKECHSESSRKTVSEKVKCQVGHAYSASEDEDVCPTCLEEYTPANPKIDTQCRHHYHLSCIYEWMERSENCPVCGKLMVFDETT